MLIKTKRILYKSLLAIWALVILLSSYLVIGSAVFKSQEHKELENVSRVSLAIARSINYEKVQILIDKINLNSDEEYNRKIEQTEEYQCIRNKLIDMRNISKEVGTVYIFIETEEDAVIVIADTEDSFGFILDTDQWPEMQLALKEKRSLIESKFYYDDEYKQNSISAYSIITDDQGNYIAMLGLDYFEEDYFKNMMTYRILPIFPSIAFALLLFFIPLMMIKIVRISFYL